MIMVFIHTCDILFQIFVYQIRIGLSKLRLKFKKVHFKYTSHELHLRSLCKTNFR